MKILIIGASSQVGLELASLLEAQGIAYHALGSQELDLTRDKTIFQALTDLKPDQVVNVAAYTDFEKIESDLVAAQQCREVNVSGAFTLAQVCDHFNLPLIHLSTSFIFDGKKNGAYDEDEEPNPLGKYGLSRWEGELAIRDSIEHHIILRSDWIFSVHRDAFFRRHIEACKANKGKVPVRDYRSSPTPAEDVARVLLAMVRQVACNAQVWGTYHYSALQPLTEAQFVEQILKEAAQYDEDIQALLPTLELIEEAVLPPRVRNTTLFSHKIMETFGIKQRSRAAAMAKVIRHIYQPGEWQQDAGEDGRAAGPPDHQAEPAVNLKAKPKPKRPRKPRRPAIKDAEKKSSPSP